MDLTQDTEQTQPGRSKAAEVIRTVTPARGPAGRGSLGLQGAQLGGGSWGLGCALVS